MKIFSILLIITYIMLPLFCSGELNETPSGEIISCEAPADPWGGQTGNLQTDYCETTCCCAGHLPLPGFTGISPPNPIARRFAYEPQLSLPLISDRIFIPPKRLLFSITPLEIGNIRICL